MPIYPHIKRATEIVTAPLLLLVLSPLMAVIALAILCEDGGPVIFKQKRLGRAGKPFDIYKFRSMKQGADVTDNSGYNYKNDPRITRVGRLLRATSLDELPQLVNIMRGDMSYIGPRPALTFFPNTYDEYTPEQKRMFCVRPGVTGWAQVNGRKNVPWPKRITLNIYYVNNMSLWLDLRILVRTIGMVLSNADNNNTRL